MTWILFQLTVQWILEIKIPSVKAAPRSFAVVLVLILALCIVSVVFALALCGSLLRGLHGRSDGKSERRAGGRSRLGGGSAVAGHGHRGTVRAASER